MYRVGDFLWMLADRQRVEAYTAAIRAAVRPGDTVVEIGAGIGFFSVLAARAGAAHVHAIDTNPAVHLAARVAEDNGCRDRVFVHHADVRDVTLPAPADVILADLRGPTPFAGTSLEVLIDVRDRLLRPAGRMISAADTLYVAPCRAPRAWTEEIAPALARADVRLAAAGRVVHDTPLRCTIVRDDLLGPAVEWLRLDYATLATPHQRGTAVLVMDDNARVDGLAVWFTSDLGGGIQLSTAPSTGAPTYSQMYLPFRDPVPLAARAAVNVELGVRRAAGHNVWCWRVRADGRVVVDQNSLAEFVIDPAAL